MGVAGYSEMAHMLGLYDVAEKYAGIAKKMAVKWEEMANEGDHYRLAFDRENTWSQKYNMIWDKMWNLNLFPNNVIDKEVSYYLTKQNPYGLPLDSRKEYTKSDWIMWIAAMSPDQDTFEQFINPLYKYINETTSRVPISDWHHTDSGKWVGFRARSVIGGYWMQVLMNKVWCIPYVMLTLLAFFLGSCDDGKEVSPITGSGGTPFNPAFPIRIDSIYPKAGSAGQRVLIYGENFGNNPSQLEVYIGGQKSSVVNVKSTYRLR